MLNSSSHRNDDVNREIMPPFNEIIDCRSVLSFRSVGGGCISEAWRVDVEDFDGSHRSCFVKGNRREFFENFDLEAQGLKELARWIPNSIPSPAKVHPVDQNVYLTLPWIDVSQKCEDHARLGQVLAKLHVDSRTTDHHHGWATQNYLGASCQPNEPCKDWASFVAQNRIGAQVRAAVDSGLMSASIRRRLEMISSRMTDLLDGRRSVVSLLHGDLWSGNYLFDCLGQPFLIDPAVHRGCAEAEFGMIELYGNCRPAFYEAYLDEHPLPDGWQRRVRVYVLYHLLNHLNLFGSGYLGQCQTVADQILSG